MTNERRPDAIALAVLAFLATLFFSDVLLGISQLYVRDIAQYYFPARKVLREIVLSGEFPYWNRTFSSGQPMAANPEHAVFYPLTWLHFLPGFESGFHLPILAHVYIALGGMYALLRSMRCRASAAFLGALSFGLGGIVLSSLAFMPLILSLAWLPLTCLYARRFLIEHRPRDLALAALFLGLQMLGGEPVTILQTAMLLGVYGIWRGARDGGRGIAKALGAVAVVGLLGAGVAAVQLIPAIDHSSDSVRARGFDLSSASRWSMPPIRVVEVFHPFLLGHMNTGGKTLYWGGRLYPAQATPYYLSIYSGLLVAVLAAAGLLSGMRGAGLAITLIAGSVLLAAGSHTPAFRLLHEAGIARSLRFPEKFILVAVFTAIVAAARALDRLVSGDERVRRLATRCAIAAAVVALVATAFALSPSYEHFFLTTWRPNALEPAGEMIAASRRDLLVALARCALLVALLRSAIRPDRRVLIALLAGFTVLDLTAMLPETTPRVSPSYYAAPPAAQRFPANREAFRIFHQAAWETRSTAALTYLAPHPDLPWIYRNALLPVMPASWGLQAAIEIDFDMTALLPSADFARSAWELSTVRPADWTRMVSSMSNVWYRGVYRDPREALRLAGGDLRAIEPVAFVENEHFPRYYFADELIAIRSREEFVVRLASRPFRPRAAFVTGPAFNPSTGRVLAWSESHNDARLDVEADGRAFLVMSVTPHKYWRITIDGTPAPAVVTNVGYQGVVVPRGRHVVEMRYRNPRIAAGGVITGVALAVLAALALAGRGRRAPLQ